MAAPRTVIEITIGEDDLARLAARARSRTEPASRVEQARIVRLLLERVDLSSNGIEVRLRAEGLQTLVEELRRRQAA